MKTTKKNTAKEETNFNPAIREKAQELFDLIEEQHKEDGQTTGTSEKMHKEMGDLLANHQGVNELRWAFLMARTKRQEAEWNWDNSIWYMNDNTLSELHILVEKVSKIVNIWNNPPEDNQEFFAQLRLQIERLQKLNPEEIKGLIDYEWKSRAEAYKEELQAANS